MWLGQDTVKKWRPDSLEARIFAIAEAEAFANGVEDAADAAMEAVFSVLSWLYSRPYSLVAEMVEEQFGISTSAAALSGFWKRFSGPWLLERMRRSSAAARTLAKELDRQSVAEATRDMTAQLAFEMLSNPEGDPNLAVKLIKALLMTQRQELDERKVTLLEAKARQADEAREVLGSSSLSQEEQNRRLRDILK